MLIALGIPYKSEEAIALAEKVMGFINEEGHRASATWPRRGALFQLQRFHLRPARGASPPQRHGDHHSSHRYALHHCQCLLGIEPIFAVSFLRQVLDNNILVEVNPQFEKMAREKGFFSPELMKEIAEHGSIQDLQEIPPKCAGSS